MSFVPTRMLPKVDRDAPPSAHADLRGHVSETAVKKNDEFAWALVESFRGSYDVVVDTRLPESRLTVGGVVSGSFWLSGRLHAASQG